MIFSGLSKMEAGRHFQMFSIFTPYGGRRWTSAADPGPRGRGAVVYPVRFE